MFRQLSKWQHWLCPIKDSVGLCMPGIDKIPCAWNGQTGRTILKHWKEHERYSWRNQPDKSTLSEHCLLQPYWNSSSIISRVEDVWTRVILEVSHIQIDSLPVNRETGLTFDSSSNEELLSKGPWLVGLLHLGFLEACWLDYLRTCVFCFLICIALINMGEGEEIPIESLAITGLLTWEQFGVKSTKVVNLPVHIPLIY